MSSDPGLELADMIASAVLAVPGVHDLRAGVAGEAATYLPGRRVDGVVVRDGSCSVHVVMEWGATVSLTADRVRTVVGGLVDGPIDVVVEDVTDPSTPRREATDAPSPGDPAHADLSPETRTRP